MEPQITRITQMGTWAHTCGLWYFVMAALVAAIHAFTSHNKDVDELQ